MRLGDIRSAVGGVVFILAGVATTVAEARELPNASYFVSGDVLPGIAEGEIVPVFVHLQTGGDRMEWSFTTSYTPDENMCEQTGKCRRTVQSLAYRVEWADDGTLEILETERNDGEGMVIDRADLDGTFIYDEIRGLVDGGLLSLSADGGTLERQDSRAPRTAELIPATFDQLRTALSFSQSFQQSPVMLDQCVIRQVLNIGKDPSPDATHGEVLKAAAYMRWLEDQERMASIYPIPQDMVADAEVAQNRLKMASFAFIALSRPMLEALLLNGTTLTDADLLAKATEAVDRLHGEIGDDFDALKAEVLTDRRDEFLAALRIQARFRLGLEKGRDPIAMLCSDVTLGG